MSNIKETYLIKGEEDKFTKTIEYQTKMLNFDNTITENYVKALSSFGIGSAINTIDFLYRKKNDVDVMLVKVGVCYMTTDEMNNPKVLKDVTIIFLADGEPIELKNVTGYDFGYGVTGMIPKEETLLEIGLEQFIQLCNSKTIEYRMTGSKGKLSEGSFSDIELYRIKGFYNALFDEDFETEELLKYVQKEEELEKKEAEEREADQLKREEDKAAEEKSNSNCFVVTATMGENDHPIVNDYRQFRDHYLLPNIFGKMFVSFYYIIGPFIAKLISKSNSLRKFSFNYFVKPIHRLISDDYK